MDAYSGYNQILMHEDDKAKTSFIIERGTYCYKVMPLGLKNARATYQRIGNKIFKKQIDKTMKVYVDDMLVKAPKRVDHIGSLAQSFSLLRQYRMKLNPKTRYPKLEKLILALVVYARKLRPYYQAHRVIVMTNSPLRLILHSPDASQRLMKWAIELSQYDLLYRPRTAIKAQALAFFVSEFTPSAEKEKLVN
ncbi:hypothetical protein L3X38_007849 [Prunus dulcis]|uniref:Reverse transcriptase domain-containing protein n=1 Tax=Prunus dulcis TaxID=3755 RepID=A0AAD4ZVI9_PRUDU|nr:hypothetical protein L3X38_007849 [Prunus dulcis]